MSDDVAEEPGTEDQEQAPEGADKPAKKQKPLSGKDKVVKLGRHIEIYADRPLPQYDIDCVKAYEAVGAGGSPGKYFALICEKHLVPRQNAAMVYSEFLSPAVVPLVARGVVYWPLARQERYVLVYRDVLGRKILTEDSGAALGLRQEDIMESVVKPMVDVLLDFRDKDFVHGAIRPSNMFNHTSSEKIEKIILGECLSVPASYAQPSLYEPIERAMAEPIGRGTGTIADDLYAFGVSLTVMLRSKDPLQGMDEREIIRQKIEHGSYAAITGKDRFKGSILELLRGLLHDDPLQRWSIDDVLSWLEGHRLSPKQSLRQHKAPRPMTFSGKKYFYTPFLAMDLDDDVAETLKIVESGDLAQWLDRAMEDENTLEKLEKAVEVSRQSGKGPGYEERLAANVSAALDPLAPIRYRGQRLTGEGFGNCLAKNLVLQEDISPFIDMLSEGVVVNWIMEQENPNLDIGSLLGRFDSCRSFMRQSRVGYGIERCLYLLAPEVHCLGEKLKDYFVRTPEDMVMAFEDMCAKGNAPASFLDRHSAAFLFAKDYRVIDSYAYDLDSEEEHKKILANLKCLATIQKRSNMGALPEIAQAFSSMLPAVYERFHDSKVRERIERNIERFAAAGDLVKMANLLSNPEVVNQDLLEFFKAMREYKALSYEAALLEKKLADASTFGKKTGKAVSAVLSCTLSAFVILFMTFVFLTSHIGF